MELIVVQLIFVILPVAYCQNSCWWTGCQKNDWAVRGCAQYNRYETDTKACDNGLEYYCCEQKPATKTNPTTPANNADCWWTGCQSSSWAVKGCDQYNRTQSDIKACSGGSEYFCCAKPVTQTKPEQSCWWTGCQLNSWAVTGCKQYNLSQSDSRNCQNGKEYYCCPQGSNENKDTNVEVECLWSACQPRNWTQRGCPTDSKQKGTQACSEEDGDMFECCSEKQPETDNEIELSTGESFINYVKYLLLKGKNFKTEPDNLPCLELDKDKQSIFQIEKQGIYTCDLCPYFPQKRFINVFLSNLPTDIVPNIIFPECFGVCFDRNDCVAFSYDHLEHTCYIFNNTVGTFIEGEKWTTIMMTQPVGILDKWMYSRHTSITGDILQSSKENTFQICLSKCIGNTGCNYLSYSIASKNCSMFSSQEKIKYIDLNYGHISAFKISSLPVGSDTVSRFVEVGDDLFDTDSSNSVKSSKDCSSMKNATHSGFFSQSCLTSGALGCDSTTGCKLCYYPEKTNAYENLAMCPDSEWVLVSDLKQSVQKSTKSCLEDPTCVAVGYSSSSKELHLLTLTNFNSNSYTTKFLLQYPIKQNSDQVLVSKFDYLFNYDIEKISNNAASFQELNGKTLRDCLTLFQTNNYYIRMSYFNNKCKISSEEVKFVFKSGDYVTAFKTPDITSPLIYFARTPGFLIPKEKAKITFNQCSKNCDLTCAQKCNNEYKAWCSHFSLEQYANQATCYFFEIFSDSLKDSINLQENSNGQIFTKTSKLDFTLDSLNNINPFQSTDLYTCFQPDSVSKQSQTSLTTLETTDNQTSGVAIRRKRGFFDFVKKAFKAVGDFVVNTVKDVVKPIVDTAKGVVNTVKNVVKGDFDKAKESFMNIPIVKDVKTAVDLGKAVVTGDWDTAKEKGADLLQSSTLDIATSLIPVGGKVIGKGLKTIGKALKKPPSSVKNSGKKNIDKVNDNNKKIDSKKNNDKDNNNNDIDPQRNQCKRRTKRATNSNKRKRPSDCDDDDDDDDLCPVVHISDAIAKTMNKCRNRKVKADCEFECNPGYDEPEREIKCVKVGSQSANWSPKPDCERISCGATVYPLIPLTTPHVSTFGNLEFGKILTAFVVLYDKWRKLPIWSIALHQSNQFSSEDYTALKELKRAGSFKPFPCPELTNYQASKTDYYKSGWDQGHLTPANVARWSEKAKLSSNLYINVAPQDPYTNQVPWSNLEGHVECFSKTRRSLVATGICSNSIGRTKSNLEVPSCYWKMVCYKDEQGKEQVVGFITDNSHVSSPADKTARRKQVLTPVSQREVKKLLQSLHLKMRSPWLYSATEINRGRPIKLGASATVWFPVNPFDCERADDLSDEEKAAWEASLNRDDNKNSKTKRSTGSSLKRGCTNKADLENMKSLLGVYAGTDGDETDNPQPEVGGGAMVSVQNCNKRIIGYYTSWGDKEISGRELRKLTHVIYAFLEMHEDGTVEVGSADRKNSANIDDETNKARKRLENLMQLASNFPLVKVMFAVGGWENSQYFSDVAASPGKRITFIASVIKLIQRYAFAGLDVDWEHPVTGGAKEGTPADKQNYVLFMKEIRTALDNLASEQGRSEKFLLSFAGAAGQWTLDPGFDLPGLLQYADFANIMTYDYFGAWASKWGAYTGPPAPLYFGMPPRFSGKTNTDWTVKYYTCKTKLPHKLNMGVPFYGRYWKNVGPPVDGQDGMWRTASKVNGIFEGGYVPYNKIQSDYLSKGFQQFFHDKSKTPYAWNAGTSTFLGYENKQSLQYKVDYAVQKNVGGLMIWAVELDDDDLTMLDTVSSAPLCTKTNPNEINHKCSPIDEKRWWTSEDGDDLAGLCGRSAPLYKGYYPVCDPDDPGYSCCGPAGYCGTGDKYCKCATCKDYLENPDKILENPIKPTVPVTWYFLNDPDGKRGRCGRKIPKINDVFPTCNPDDQNAYCCSNGGYCGNTDEYCKCNGCVDFKKNPNYRYGPKKWWELSDGQDKAGKCGPTAPKVDGKYEAECEPNTKFSCCSANGYCGSGSEFCDCPKCKKFT